MQRTAALERQLADDCDRRGDAAGRDRHLAAEQCLAAMAAYRRNRPDVALQLLRKSAELAPDDATTWFHIGEMEYHLGRRDAADEAFRTALELRPHHGRARDFLDRRAP
jgi:Flp pilus assembly protein TadD